MKQKESYTLEELYDNLEITLTELSKQSGFSHGTLTRIRDKVPARRSTVNKLLRVFSQIYGIELSISNVEGIALEEKGKHEKPIKVIDESVPVPPVSTPTIPAISQPEDARIRNVGAKGRTWKQPKKKEDYLPEGCILYSDFAKSHGLPPTTFRDHMFNGLGPGLIGESTDTIPERDRVKYEERKKPGRPKEKERYLTAAQQKSALEFWKRHDVDFSECDNPECPCRI